MKNKAVNNKKTEKGQSCGGAWDTAAFLRTILLASGTQVRTHKKYTSSDYTLNKSLN